MQLYVRIRGRAHGPYSEAKLIDMVHRGQLSRVHMVSTDGQNWKKASDFPQLFDSARLAVGGSLGQPAGDHSSGNSQGQAGRETPASASSGSGSPSNASEWYYSDGTASFGPFPLATIKKMCDSGELSRETLVWKPDFDGWKPAGEVIGLFSVGSRTTSSSSEPAATDSSIAPALAEAIAASSPWVIFLAVSSLLYSATCFVLFVLQLVSGVAMQGINGAIQSLELLVHAGIFIVIGVMLILYARSSGKLRYFSSIPNAVAAMKSLRSCWIFLSIFAIVGFAIFGLKMFLLIIDIGAIAR